MHVNLKSARQVEKTHSAPVNPSRHRVYADGHKPPWVVVVWKKPTAYLASIHFLSRWCCFHAALSAFSHLIVSFALLLGHST